MPAKTIPASDAFTLYMAARYGSKVSEGVKDLIKKIQDTDIRGAGRVLVRQTAAGARPEHVELARSLAKNVAFEPIKITAVPRKKTARVAVRKKEHAPSTSSGSKHRPQS